MRASFPTLWLLGDVSNVDLDQTHINDTAATNGSWLMLHNSLDTSRPT